MRCSITSYDRRTGWRAGGARVIVSETEEAREGPFNSLSETRGKQTPLTLIEAVQPARRFVSNLAKRRLVHALFNNNKKKT